MVSALRGSLPGTGVPPIVKFLTGLQKTGRLRVSQGRWVGEVAFDRGQLVAASLGPERGLAALDAIVLALPDAEFAFSDEAAPAERNLELPSNELQAYLDQLTAQRERLKASIPSSAAVPRAVEPTDQDDAPTHVALDRATLTTLLVVDGRRSVAEIAGERGLARTTRDLAALSEQGLIRFDAPSGALVDAMAAASTAPPTTRIVATQPCPKLGFADDPANNFGRPTRLHRCFAGGDPEVVATQVQRELCLTEQFPTCARFTAASGPDTTKARPPATAPKMVASRPPSREVEKSNGVATPRVAIGPTDAPPDQSAERARRARDAAATAPTQAAPLDADVTSVPMREPLRGDWLGALSQSVGRLEGWRGVAAAPAQRIARHPIPVAIAGCALASGLIALALVGDRSAPSPSIVVDQGASRAATPVDTAAPTAATPQPAVAGAASAPAPTAVPAAAVPTIAAPTSVPIAAAPAAAAAPAPTAAAAPPPAPTQAIAFRTLVDERFADNGRNWPNNPQSTAWLAEGAYHLFARESTRFVAVGAPIGEPLRDVRVTGTFRKVGGPAGGGYGLIVRDQGSGTRDGRDQGGQYYVLEAGDRGEVGIWRREGDRWIDVLPWTPSEAVRPGDARNELTAEVIGQQLTFSVNGTQVASQVVVRAEGAVGVFAGGDLNEVVLERFVVEAPG